MMGTHHDITGGCHCGNIAFTFSSPVAVTDLPLRTCDCSFCTKHGACYTSHPEGRLQVLIRDDTQVKPYRFGTETAAANICTNCGIHPFISAELDGRLYAVLNANSINGLQIEHAAIPPALHLVDFSVEERITRWKKLWIGQVEIRKNSLKKKAAVNAIL